MEARDMQFDDEAPPVEHSAPPTKSETAPVAARSHVTLRTFQVLGVVAAAIAGVAAYDVSQSGRTFPALFGYTDVWPWAVAVGVGVLVVPYLLSAIIRWASFQIRHASLPDIISGTVGLLVGSLIALLLTGPLSQVKFLNLNVWLPLLTAVVCGYLGIAIGVLKRDELGRTVTSVVQHRRAAEHDDADVEDRAPTTGARRNRHRAEKSPEKPLERVLVDTSAIIDGRIADISQTGFIMGTLVVPRFVLEELQHIADSADTLRRNRGRRGLDILNRLQKETTVPVEISDADFDNIPEVDHKLVKLARQIHAPIITNDFNLNKVAELQGIKVLNINELANAVKPALLPGEDMDVKIIQEGKELNQGVGYLDDGTMIVVEGGKAFLNSAVEVTVTRVLQTVAGRMIFAQPKQLLGSRRA